MKKNKRVTFIDVFIVLIFLLLIFAILSKNFWIKNPVVNADDTFYVTFSCDATRDFLYQNLEEGQPVYEQHGDYVGTIVSYETQPATEVMNKDDGTNVLVEVDGKEQLDVTVECTGSVTEDGVYINGNNLVAVGSTMILETKDTIIETTITDIKTE